MQRQFTSPQILSGASYSAYHWHPYPSFQARHACGCSRATSEDNSSPAAQSGRKTMSLYRLGATERGRSSPITLFTDVYIGSKRFPIEIDTEFCSNSGSSGWFVPMWCAAASCTRYWLLCLKCQLVARLDPRTAFFACRESTSRLPRLFFYPFFFTGKNNYGDLPQSVETDVSHRSTL